MIRIVTDVFKILYITKIMSLESASHPSAPAYGAVLQVTRAAADNPFQLISSLV